MAIPISTPGRLGFYVDYSELSAPGTHTFYICRTHGSAGAVSCSYASGGDPHTNVSGTLTWADGQADIQWVTVEVPTKTVNGDHRIWIKLSSPTGGASLHLGADYTVAYGVIDDGTIAGDSDAVFYDSAAGGGGSGTQASPYNSLYDAFDNVGTKRYIYMKGTFTPDTTYQININGGGGTPRCMVIPAGRSGESTRLYIRNWPGSTFTYTGGASTDVDGFYADNGASYTTGNYMTFRGIDFDTIDCSGETFTEGFGIGYYKGAVGDGGLSVTVEKCTFDDINGSTNTGAFTPYNSSGCKMWRCTTNNIQFNGNNNNLSASHWLSFQARWGSIQRCTVTNCGSAMHDKSPNSDGITSVRFNDIQDCEHAVYVGFGGAAHTANHGIFQSNLVKDNNLHGCYYNVGDTLAVGRATLSNNVFDTIASAGGVYGIFSLNNSQNTIAYNNISHTVRNVVLSYNVVTDGLLYCDYNQGYTVGLNWAKVDGINYSTASNFCSSLSFDCNSGTGDPKFVNRTTDDYTLDTGSPCIASGVDNTDMGLYLTGIEVIGA